MNLKENRKKRKKKNTNYTQKTQTQQSKTFTVIKTQPTREVIKERNSLTPLFLFSLHHLLNKKFKRAE